MLFGLKKLQDRK